MGLVPEEGAHIEAAKYIVEQLFYGQEAFSFDPSVFVETGIDSGLIHGSVTQGKDNIRSDIDILAIYRPGSEVLETVRNVFDATRRAYNVPIEANLITMNDALTGSHGIDPLFYRYLYSAQDDAEFSWNWPMDSLALGFSEGAFGAKRLGRVVQRYVGAKTASFSKELVADFVEFHRIQRAYELPKNLGRKVLSMLSSDFRVQDHDADDIKEGLIRFVERQSETNEALVDRIAKNIDRLLNQDSEYGELLEDTLDAKKSLKEYGYWFSGSGPRDTIATALSLSQDMGEVMGNYMRYFDIPARVFDQDSPEDENFTDIDY